MRRTAHATAALATPGRWLGGAVVLAAGALAAARTLHDARWVRLDGALFVVACGAFWLYLRAEEARLARELRVARAGTEVQRGIALRQRSPRGGMFVVFFWWALARLLGAVASTGLGWAALLVADGDAHGARRVMGIAWPWARRGELGALREVVEADLLRARGTEEALGDAIRALYAMAPLGLVEGERYRIHVLVKALLEQADGATARAMADELAQHADEELRVYAVWLRAWFDLEHLPAPPEADVRRAILLARAHGAVDLVTRLEDELASSKQDIAPAPADG